MTEIKMNELVPTDDELLLDYRKLSPFYLAIYKIVSGNSNFCSFIAGMIAGIPATLLLNLVVTSISDISNKKLYLLLYLFTFVMSVVFCWSSLKFAVIHIEISEACQRHNESDTVEEHINWLFKSFYERLGAIKKSTVTFITSGIVTICGIFALFFVINM